MTEVILSEGIFLCFFYKLTNTNKNQDDEINQSSPRNHHTVIQHSDIYSVVVLQ